MTMKDQKYEPETDVTLFGLPRNVGSIRSTENIKTEHGEILRRGTG